MKTNLNNLSRHVAPGTRLIFQCSRIALIVAGLLATPARAALLIDYKFNEGSGTAVSNAGTLGSAANGVLTGGWSTNTPSGTGFSGSFTGASATEGVTTGSVVTGLNGLTQVTGVLWLNLQAAPAANDRLLSNASANNGFDLAISAPSSGSISASNFSLSLNVDSVIGTASANITQSGWLFLAFTYDGTLTSNNMKFYLGTTTSGVAQLGGTKSENAGALGTSTNPFEVANTGLTPSDRTPPGLFDNVRIYDTVLDSTGLEAVRLSTVPEPSTWTMLAATGTAFVVLRRRRTTYSSR